jgi:hypothetical protein
MIRRSLAATAAALTAQPRHAWILDNPSPTVRKSTHDTNNPRQRQ